MISCITENKTNTAEDESDETAFVKSSGTEPWSSVGKVNNLRQTLFFLYTWGNSSVGDRKSPQVFEEIMWLLLSRGYTAL